MSAYICPVKDKNDDTVYPVTVMGALYSGTSETLIGSLNGVLKCNGSSVISVAGANDIPGFTYTTTEPTAANTDGIKVVVLSSEPSTKYAGWLYLITG